MQCEPHEMKPRFRCLENVKSAIVVHVQMGENYFFHVARSDAERAQLRADLFFISIGKTTSHLKNG